MPTLAEIAAHLQLPPPNSSSQINISGLNTLDQAGPNDLSFLSSEHYVSHLEKTQAAAVIVSKRVKLSKPTTTATLVVEDADLAMAKILELFAPPIPRPAAGIDATACVSASADVHPTAALGEYVVIGARTKIGQGTIIHPGAVIGADVVIGENCEIFSNVVIRERITIGSRVIIHAGSVIGTDGFGYRWDGKQHAKIPQIGTVIIEDDVEIGSCVCIDRAKFAATKIGAGTKIDNLVQIAHNVVIGKHCIIVGQAGLAGSVKLGNGVILGGQCAIRDHVTLADGSMVAACSGVAEDVDPKQIYSGLPALPHRQSLREQAALRRLPDLVTQVRKLQEEIEQLKAR